MKKVFLIVDHAEYRDWKFENPLAQKAAPTPSRS